jgi:hypothetical protein
MATRFPAEQDPDIDPELPQPEEPETVDEFFAEPLGLPPGAEPDESPTVESFEPLNQGIPEDQFVERDGLFVLASEATPVPDEDGFVETPGGLRVLQEDLDAEQDEAIFRQQQEEQNVPSLLNFDAETLNSINIQNKVKEAQQQATIQQRYNQTTQGDWRVRLRLAPGANYLYNDTSNTLLAPLRASNGVIFPYTPTISTSFNANYDKYDLTHSNYRGYFYKNSTVGDIQIIGEFTAQDTSEAQYLLAISYMNNIQYEKGINVFYDIMT